MSEVKLENDMLRRENAAIRVQMEIWSREVKRSHRIARAARRFVKEVSMSPKSIHDAFSAMRRAERMADKEWLCSQRADGSVCKEAQNFF